ncbi:adenosylhomocysteinase [Curtobacterium sp. Leaf261]|uniref:adenosylhomocysteinase n=1 Tax=Curtobacterium sp. Leaf261 TaxID=1736311 RepID=UPI0012E29B03|nr:adenosylhomocysteinase [Curtobacterium sp. Leaf261]
MAASIAHDPAAVAWASAAVRRFAAATNLLVAGRRFRIVGDGPDARVLAAVLTGLGARAATDGDTVDQLWCIGDMTVSTAAIEALADRPRGSSLVVVDAGRHVPAVDEDAFGPARFVRPGVLGVPMLSDDVFLVSTGRDLETTAAAEERIRWAGRFMPVSRALAATLREDGILRGMRIGVSMVLEPKTAVLSLLLLDAGADVVVYAHADETDDAVAEALRNAGLVVFASSRASMAEQRALALEMLDREPHLLVDDGAHVIRLAHEARPELLPEIIGAAEETTSGLRPLRIMAERGVLAIPVIAVNDARAKTLFDNRYGTGQSCVFAILDLLDGVAGGTGVSGVSGVTGVDGAPHRVRPGGTAVVVGFGHVGEGVALVLAALGMRVVVAETDPVRALQAVFAGYAVAPLGIAVGTADLVVSATGVRDTISLDVLRACAPGVVVAVAGGVDQEIAIEDALAAGATRSVVGRKVERFVVPGADARPESGSGSGCGSGSGSGSGSAVLVLDDGGCINITAGEGNPIEIMDMSFAVQLGAIRTLLEHGAELDVGVHPIDPAIDDRIAAAALAHLGLVTDPAGRPADALDHPEDDVRSSRFGPVHP